MYDIITYESTWGPNGRPAFLKVTPIVRTLCARYILCITEYYGGKQIIINLEHANAHERAEFSRKSGKR